MSAPHTALQWAVEHVGGDYAAMAVVIDDAEALGLGIHHDGSGRVDLSVFRHADPDRTVEAAGLGTLDVAEYEVSDGRARLAGVSHPVSGAHVTGRDGGQRRRCPVPDEDAFASLGLPREALPLLAADFLRVAQDNTPHRRLEAGVDPATFEVGSILRDLGVDDAAITGMQALADMLPLGRETSRGPLLCAWQETMAYSHFSLACSGGAPTLKSYVLVQYRPRRDVLVKAHGVDWPAQVRWATAQLPLRRAVQTDLHPWTAAVDPHNRGGFQRRLDLDGLDPRTALVPRERPDPAWWQAYELLVASVSRTGEVPAAAWAVPFGPLLWPVAREAAPELMRVDLLQRLCRIAAPSLSELMWRDRPFGQRLAAQLSDGDHPRDNFEAFCSHHARDRLTEVLTEYPVLGMQLAIEIESFQAAAGELLTRVEADREVLAQHFGARGPLTEVSLTGGDAHNGGRSVRVLRFGDTRVVYKPRSVRLEALYTRVARALGIAAPDVVDQGDYGYVALVHGRPAEEYASFYRNAGGQLALLHALAATDCHQENLIASGDHLALIDAETLLTGFTPDDQDGDPTSVLRVGLLPGWLWLDGRRRAIDITALGVDPGGTVHEGTGWRAVNTDAMIRGPVSVAQPHPPSLPTPKGVAAPLAEHVEDLVAGFEETYRALTPGRGTWLDGVDDAANRAVLRPTYVYASLLRELVEPSAMRSWQQRAWVLERLTRAYVDDPDRWPLAAAEQQALHSGDVPYFQCPLRGGGTVWADGSLPGWPVGDQLVQVRARLARLGDDDLREQVGLIRASVAAKEFQMSAPHRTGAPLGLARPAPEVAQDCLGRVTARRENGRPMWLGPMLLPDGEHVVLRPIGIGLYDGRLGLAIADVLAGRETDALDTVLQVADDPQRLSRLWQAEGPGLAGIGGLLRGLDLLDHPVPEDVLDALLTPQRVAAETRLDLIGGVAGLIGPLARRGEFEPVIAAAADVLVAAQSSQGAWRTLPARHPLTGLAHGAAGIAMALVEAGVALGDDSLIEAAVRGLDYEATVFDSRQRNWPDFRDSASGFMLGWCAGAPGIALTRRRVLDLLPDHPRASTWREELRDAVETTGREPALGRDHVCCGNAGRLAILRALDHDGSALEHVIVSRVGLPTPMLDLDADVLPMPGLFTGLPGIALVLGGTSDWVWKLLV